MPHPFRGVPTAARLPSLDPQPRPMTLRSSVSCRTSTLNRAGISDLDAWFANRTLFLFSTQECCHQVDPSVRHPILGRPSAQRDQPRSGAALFTVFVKGAGFSSMSTTQCAKKGRIRISRREKRMEGKKTRTPTKSPALVRRSGHERSTRHCQAEKKPGHPRQDVRNKNQSLSPSENPHQKVQNDSKDSAPGFHKHKSRLLTASTSREPFTFYVSSCLT